MTLLFSPWFWLAVLLSAAAMFGAGYHQGGKHAREHAAIEQLKVIAEARKQESRQANADRQTEQKYEVARETVRTVYIKVKEKVDANIAQNPDYAECGLDADGLRLYNAKPEADTPPATPRFDSLMPGFAASPQWQISDDPAHQPGALSAVLRLPGQAPGAERVGGPFAAGRGDRLDEQVP